MVSPSTGQRGLYLFSNDLRLDDNPALNHLINQCDQLLFVYLIDPQESENSHRGFPRLSLHRWQFIWDCLRDLNSQLEQAGHHLLLLKGNARQLLPELCRRYRIDQVAGSYNSGCDEYRQWQILKHELSAQQVSCLTLYQNTLFSPEWLPMDIEQLPKQFTPFRKAVENLTVPQPVDLSLKLSQRACLLPLTEHQPWPEQPPLLSDYQQEQRTGTDSRRLWPGGSREGWRHYRDYLWDQEAVTHYKATRNILDSQKAFHHTSQLSPWLAQGCLSPRQVWRELTLFENQVCRNESTEWLKFELLWREFFHWNAHRLGPALYQFGGERGKTPLTSFYPQRFKSWCEGTTPYPIVNACMKQLKATGMLSNRGRQIVASALVNELEIDWRYGAAWFEYQLIDYDPGSNYGNWQYIAGVGSDPRGGRHFNLQKQTEQYDPDQRYIRRWQGGFAPAADAVGIDDWPILPPDGTSTG